ncbi:Gfo/Idh/MocA family oxidoreductase [Agromyces sp. SYSU K20354]|uniref:Gfo/Idh/MocA family protein n=1 Tax=Agromyces cavernae TaxID=2898659 RepID=UPI001E58349D|nr:Gfo/Idh/MocA family oxidoreductase [Agromyces cavernae]MCD2443849.1 Gfo/Idh/MocA family oxidoreductase [Agromyces cavernae]
MTSHRIAIVGAGRMARAHAAAWDRAGYGDAIEYVVSPRTRPELEAAPHARWVKRLDDALADPAVDILSVCTPTPTHAEIAIEALRSGRNVLLEKPIAVTEADALAIAETARRSPGVLMVAHVVRFMRRYADLADRVADGSVGSVRAVHAARLSSGPPGGSWFDDERRSGGILVDFAIHDFDQANLLLGTPVAVRSVRTGESGFGTPVATTVEYAGGGVAQVLSVADLPADFEFCSWLDVVGTAGTDAARSEDAGDPPDDPFLTQARYFLECVESQAEPSRCSTEHAIAALRVSLAARASLQSSVRVPLT